MVRLLPVLLVLGCAEDPFVSGAGEPILVRDGTFHRGALPDNTDATLPQVLFATSVGYVVTQGQGNIAYNGLVSKDAYSVAVAFDGIGSGYWTVPAGGPDVTQNNDLVFELTIDFTRDVPYGLQTVTFVAIDEEGRAGPPLETTVCVLPESAEGSLAACDPALSPQSAVLSLTWDTDVDLDLVVITPEGRVVSWKAPASADEDDPNVDPTTIGEISQDSNANCHIDSIRRESLVFPGVPLPGEYQIFASLYSDCGQRHVNYQSTLFERIDAADGTFPIERTDLGAGVLLGAQANAGATNGTYVATVTLP